MEEPKPRVRQTAFKVRIKNILNGNYIREEDSLSPNYIKINNQKVSRVNIIAIVVSVEGNDRGVDSLVIDDGSSRISVRSFEERNIPVNVKVGDIINIIGRLREYTNEKYITPEILKKTNQKWMLIRQRELEQKEKTTPKEVPITEEDNREEQSKDTNLGNSEKILQYIRENDKGNGVEIEEILNKINIQESEKYIEAMLKEGDLFENIPGRVKLLE